MTIITDIRTFGIVFLGVLVLLGVLGIAYAIFKAIHQKASENWSALLDNGKSNILDVINSRQDEFSRISVDQFYDLNREFFRSCVAYGMNKGLDCGLAIEDTIIYSKEIVDAYAQTFTLGPATAEHANLVSDYIKATLSLETSEVRRHELLKGGLSNP